MRVRIDAWLKHAGETPELQSLKALFSADDINKATAYVPRWPLLVHLFAAII